MLVLPCVALPGHCGGRLPLGLLHEARIRETGGPFGRSYARASPRGWVGARDGGPEAFRSNRIRRDTPPVSARPLQPVLPDQARQVRALQSESPRGLALVAVALGQRLPEQLASERLDAAVEAVRRPARVRAREP